MKHYLLKVQGMSCAHCKSAVESALRAVPGVEDAQVDLAAGTASVACGDGVDAATLKAAVQDQGYDVLGVE